MAARVAPDRAGRELERAYLRTTYLVQVPRRPLRLRIGRRSRPLEGLLTARRAGSWAFVSAWNPGSKRLPRWCNDARHAWLERELRRAGHRMVPGWGVPDRPGWRPERSVLVFGMSPAAAVLLGRRFGQNAVVIGRAGRRPGLRWCS